MMSNPIGLYIHVPFCVKKCPYCDFYSVEMNTKNQGDTSSPSLSSRPADYTRSVIRNLTRYNETYNTIYFGGGTPSLLSELAKAVLATARYTDDAEITFECNPETVTEQTLTTLRNAGVNRLSFGVQSLDDNELSALGRIHNSGRAEQAIRLASSLGFENISADLMLGIPHQTPSSLTHTIEKLRSLPITHISAYMLKIEPDTRFGKTPPIIPDEDEQANLYLQAVQQLEESGFLQYEISNFAKKGYESRHNLKYWHCEEYIGIGPAAHSFYKGKRYAVPRDLIAFVRSDTQPEEYTDISPDNTEEHILLGLRLTEGIPLTPELTERLTLIPKHLYKVENNRLSLTPEGFLVSNEIISLLI